MLKELATSKKFWMTVLGVLGVNAAWAETHSTTLVIAVAVLQAVYLFAQGLADHGKSAAQIHSGQAIAGVAEAVKSKIAADATTTPAPPILPLLVAGFTGSAFAVLAIGFATACTPAEIKASPVAHEIRTDTDLAAELCKLDPEMQAAAQVKGFSVADVCTGVQVLAPFVDSILSARREAHATLAARRSQCLPIKETAP